MKISVYDGGAAFPTAIPESNTGAAEFIEGMTLRDHFAGQAMAAMHVSPSMSIDCMKDERKCASWAYSQADAMLAERVKETK